MPGVIISSAASFRVGGEMPTRISPPTRALRAGTAFWLWVGSRGEIIDILTEIFLQRDTAAWVTLLIDAGVPCAPVQTIDQVFHAPQVIAREMVVEARIPTA